MTPAAKSPPEFVLGIESSCDEMAAAVLRGGREILSSVVHGQARPVAELCIDCKAEQEQVERREG